MTLEACPSIASSEASQVEIVIEVQNEGDRTLWLTGALQVIAQPRRRGMVVADHRLELAPGEKREVKSTFDITPLLEIDDLEYLVVEWGSPVGDPRALGRIEVDHGPSGPPPVTPPRELEGEDG